MVELNITLAIQIVNFIIALVALNWLFISPVRKIIRKRREMTESMSRDVVRFTDEAALRLKRYEKELVSARAQAAVQRDWARAQAVDSGRAILESAQDEADMFLQRSSKEAEQEVESARRTLSAKVSNLAGKVASRILE